MDVRSVGRAVWFWHRTETHPMPQAKRDRLCELTRDHRIVGGANAQGRRRGDLELPCTKLGQERVGGPPDLTHGREQRFAEEALLPERIEFEGLPSVGGHAGVREFLLEGGK